MKSDPRRERLTKKGIDRLAFDPDGPVTQIVWDDELTGFGVRLLPSGRKSFIIRYRNESGKQRYLTLGPFGKLTLKQARDLARDKFAQTHQGVDVQAEASKKRQAVATRFDDVGREFIERYSKVEKKSWESDESRLFPKHHLEVNALHGFDFETGTAEELEIAIRNVHSKIVNRGKPVEANRTLTLITTMTNWAVRQRLVSRQFRNISEYIDKAKEPAVERRKRGEQVYIRPAELSAFNEAVKAESVLWRYAIQLTFLTGARFESETLQLRWEDIRFDVGEFVFRDTKNGGDHWLPITDSIAAIFDLLPKEGLWVFPSSRGKGPLTDSTKCFKRIRSRHDFVDRITPHIIRHSVVTYMRELGIPDGTNRAIVNHSGQGMTDVYAARTLTAKRDGMNKVADFLKENGFVI